MLEIALDVAGWREGLRELRQGLNEEMESAVVRTAQAVALAARAEHEYTDRTERLTRSIRAYAARGTFGRDTLTAEVIATAPYASFVENGTSRMRARPYLGPAADRTDPLADHLLHDAVEAAVQRSGLR